MKLGNEAKEALIAGINKVADAVKVTMGAEGKTVIIKNAVGFAPKVTKDGVTVANEVDLADDYEKLGSDLIKAAANKTVDLVGDATTSTVVLTQELVNLGYEKLKSGLSHVELREGMGIAVKEVISHLHTIKKNVDFEKSRQIATISVNNDEQLGNIIAEAYQKIGVDGRVEVKEGGSDTTVVYGEGMCLDRGWALPYFITNENTLSATLENCEIIIFDGNIDSIGKIADKLREASTKGIPIVLIAEDINEGVMKTLVQSKVDGSLSVLVCISPESGENRKNILNDLAVFTGGEVYDPKIGSSLKTGKALKVVADREKTIIIVENTKTQAILSKVETLKEQIEKEEDKFAKEKLQKRLSNIQNAIATISVGGNNQIEISEKRDRVDDAVASVKSALLGGYVAGGGATLLHISKHLMSQELSGGQKEGYEVVKQAIQKPFEQILLNANLNKNFFIEGVNLYGFGVNVKSRKIEYLLDKGIIDSAKAVEVALENASSMASLVLQTDCLLTGGSL